MGQSWEFAELNPKAVGTKRCCVYVWIRDMRISRLLLALLVSVLLIVTICILFVDKGGTSSGFGSRIRREEVGDGDDLAVDLARKTLGLIDWTQVSGSELHQRLEELLRIKHSVQNELRSMEAQRSQLQLQVADLARKVKSMKTEATKHASDLQKLQLSIGQAKLALGDLAKRNTPELLPPLRLTASGAAVEPSRIKDASRCNMASCFDWSRCPFSSGFPVYLLPASEESAWVERALDLSGYRTEASAEACVFLSALDMSQSNALEQLTIHGKNHLVIDIGREHRALDTFTKDVQCMIASSSLSSSHRQNFDFAFPRFKYATEDASALWKHLPILVPIRRKFLFSFQGVVTPERLQDEVVTIMRRTFEKVNLDLTDDRVNVNFTCDVASAKGDDVSSAADWELCGDFESRKSVVVRSTFTIIPHDTRGGSGTMVNFQTRLMEALSQGSVPTILCMDHDCTPDALRYALPLSEVIDYKRVALFVAFARLPELHFLLRSITDADLFSLKLQGRQIWTHYLGSGVNLVLSALNVVRTRIGLPAAPFQDAPSPSTFGEKGPLMMDQLPPGADADNGEPLGPLEPPSPSPAFGRNFSSLALDGYDLWNRKWGAAFRSAPYNPWDPILPTEAKFFGSGSGFRPVGGGEGGCGKEFSKALGGNSAQEHFTVVMLTYQREQVLIDSLSRLHGLPYLNKVIVVWNSPDEMPSEDLRWPDIGVPVTVAKMERNSLNNRFLPFEEIDTEAVLSVDDDVHLRHDEIIFGFRVWREHRDRLVGFPGRFHAWNQVEKSWNYNSNYSCELSMVLTGAAFYHKYYAYAYTELMPAAIRDKVDEFMNCEDLAMNFLISHLTRQPPVKVTSRWTFRCPGCPVALSESDSHFQERHVCINFFARVYGYMPLLYTQCRADSVLFKTRIPQDKQKCFKFI